MIDNRYCKEYSAPRRRARTALLVTSMLTAVSVAAAQEPSPAPRTGGIDVITVTSQKRSESIQDVPISIIALGDQKLRDLEVSDFDDYAKYLPSVSYQSTAPNATTVYFRGVVSGGDGNHSASLPSVGVYLDEQPVTTILGLLPIHIYDIERVEALAGPQGTLYGASSQSGTIRIITNKPDPSGFAARYDAEVNAIEHGGVGYQFEGMVNAPISDSAAIRLVGYYTKDAGYIDNVLGSHTFPSSGVTRNNADLVEDDFNDVETIGARAALRIDLNDNWTVTPTVYAQQLEAKGVFAFDPSLGDLDISRYRDEKNKDRFIQAALTLEGKIGNFDLVYAGAYLRRQIDTNNDYTDYAYYYDVLYGYGAYFYDDMYNLIDPSQYYVGDDSFGKYSHEIRLSSPQDKRIRGVVGLFLNRQRHNIEQQYKVDNLTSLFEVTGYEDTIWLTQQLRVDRDYAIFTEVEFDITDRLTLLGGVRGYKARNTLQGYFGYSANFSSGTGEAACFGPPIVDGSPCTNLDKEVEETGETHKASISYDISDDKMIYATYSTGFRPGGVNRRGSLPPYLADTLSNYEIGWKTSWADNRFLFNAAFFYIEWKDFQFPILGQNGLTEIKNANQARIKGFEADGVLAPVEGLTINAAISVIDAELSANYCGFVDADGEPETDCASPPAPEGTRLPVVPKFKGTLTARYEYPIGSMTAHIQGSFSGQTAARSNLLDLDQAIIGDQDGYGIADFSVGLQAEHWELTAFVYNATDERADQFSFVGCGISVCGAHDFQGTNRPRTYGIRFGQEF